MRSWLLPGLGALAVLAGCRARGEDCCVVCTVGTPCGDSCISSVEECHVGPGCACPAGSHDDGSSCAGAGRAICQAACDCREGDGCGITDATGGATLGFDTPSDCEGLYVTLGCSGGGDGSIDFAACSAEVEVAECQGTGTDAAVVLPASCDSN